MNNLLRKYNQNRKSIWAVIITVALFIAILQTIFAIMRYSKNKKMQGELDAQNSQIVNSVSQSNRNNLNNQNAQNGQNATNNNYSNAGNSNNNQVQAKQLAKQAMNEFTNYCNQNQIQEAYNMLTDDCKEVLFPNINTFYQNYVQAVWNNSQKSAKVEESMYGDGIYKISYADDLLASGGYTSSNVVQDYIKFERNSNTNKTENVNNNVSQNDNAINNGSQNNNTSSNEGKNASNIKISVNKFLQKEVVNKESVVNNIYVKAIEKQTYIDYEIYKIQITNQTSQSILVSSRENANAVYMLDKKQVEYPSNIDEQDEEKLVVKPQSTTILSLKFSKMYNQNRTEVQAISFTDIITNYEQYKAGDKAQTIGINLIL